MANYIYIQKGQLLKPKVGNYIMDANNIKYSDDKSLQEQLNDLVNLIEQKENNI